MDILPRPYFLMSSDLGSLHTGLVGLVIANPWHTSWEARLAILL